MLAWTLALASGCGILSGQNPGERASLGERPFDPECRDIDLSSGRLSATSLRGLVHCFNADGRMPEITRLVDSTSDPNLAAVADLANRYLLDNPRRLFELDQTFLALDGRERLAPALENLGRVFENGALVAALIDLGHEGYFSETSDYARYVLNGFRASPSPKLLASLELLGRELGADAVGHTLDFGLTYARSKAWRSFQSRFRTTAPGGVLDLDSITGPLLRLARSGTEPGRISATSELLRLLAEGPLWKTIDAQVPDRITERAPNLAGWAALLAEIARSPSGPGGTDDTFLNHASTLFLRQTATSDVRVPCFQGTQKLIPITPLQILDEVRRGNQTLRDLLVTLYAIQPFCDFQGALPGVMPAYQALMPTVVSDASEELESWLKALSEDTLDARTSKNVDFFTRLLTEPGSMLGAGPGRLRLAAPLVQELQSRDALGDLVLLLTLPRVHDRARLNGALELAARPRAELGGESVADVLATLVSRVDENTLQRLIRSLRPLVDDEREIAAPALVALRELFWVNDAHPVVGLLRDVLADARRNEPFFTALFDIVASDRERFEAAVRELAALSKAENGRLKETLLGVSALFRRHAEPGRHEIALLDEPAFVPRARHDLQGSELVRAQARRPRLASAYDSCRKLDFDFSIDRYEAENFSAQFRSFTECLAETEDDSYLIQPLRFFNSTDIFTTDSALGRDGKSLFAWVVDQARFLVSGESRAGAELGARAMNLLRDGRLSTLLRAMPYWAGMPVGPSRGTGDSGTLVAPLLNLLEKASRSAEQRTVPSPAETRAALRARVLAMPAQVCAFDKDSADDEAVHTPTCVRHARVTDAIQAQLAVWEPSADAARRREEILDEFLDSVEHDFQSHARQAPQGGKLQTAWEKALFLRTFSQAYKQLVNPFPSPAAGTPQAENTHRPLEGLLSTLKTFNPVFGFTSETFTRDQLRAAADQVTDFLFEQAETLNVVAYYYRGSVEPKVRLVSDLDRLGLLLVNTEMRLTDGSEPGLYGLGMTPMAWDGEDDSRKPRYILDDASQMFGLPSLVDYFLIGVPAEGGCNASGENRPFDQLGPVELECVNQIRNLKGIPRQGSPLSHQAGLISVLQSYLRNQTIGRDDCQGSPTDCLGLRLVRNLGSSIWNQMPSELRSVGIPDGGPNGTPHNLKLLTALGKLGIFRKVSLALLEKETQEKRNEIRDFIRSTFLLSQHRDYEALIQAARALLDPSEIGDWSVGPTSGLARAAAETLYELNLQPSGALAIKDTALYGIAALPALELLDSDSTQLAWLARVVQSAAKPASQGGARDVLASEPGALRALLGSPFFSQMARTLYQDTRDPSGDWAALQARLDLVRAMPAYQALDVKRQVFDPILDFVADPPRAPDPGRELYDRVLLLLLREADAKNLEAVTRLAGSHRGDVEALLKMMDRLSRDGSADRLIDLARRWLPQAPL